MLTPSFHVMVWTLGLFSVFVGSAISALESRAPILLQAAEQRLYVVETVGDQKHQAATPQLLRQVVQERRDRGLVLRPNVLQRLQDRLHVAGLAARGEAMPPAGVENVERNTVALMDNAIR